MGMSFEKMIAVLWRSLGLPAPKYDADGSAVLVVDGLTIALSPSPDDSVILVSGKVGPLAENPLAREQQVSSILKANLVSLPVNGACYRSSAMPRRRPCLSSGRWLQAIRLSWIALWKP